MSRNIRDLFSITQNTTVLWMFQDCESLQDLCRRVILRSVGSKKLLDELPVPRKLVSWIRRYEEPTIFDANWAARDVLFAADLETITFTGSFHCWYWCKMRQIRVDYSCRSIIKYRNNCRIPPCYCSGFYCAHLSIERGMRSNKLTLINSSGGGSKFHSHRHPQLNVCSVGFQ